MVNISKIISTLGKLEGSSARVTLSGKQVVKALEKKGAPNEISEAISGIVSKHPNLKADVAYKASEQGYTVGAVTLRDGKEVVGCGAVSVSGLGTEEAILKARLSAGKNGEILQMSGYNNYAHAPRIQDYELSTSLKNGVLETSAKAGEFGASRSRIDIPKAVEAVGLKEEAALAIKKGNNFLDELWGNVRNLLAGKEVDMTKLPTLPSQGKTMLVKGPIAKECKKMPDLGKIKSDKHTEFDFDKIRANIKDYEFKNTKFIKTPNGKEVTVDEFKKVMEDYFRISTKQMKTHIKNGNDKIANDIACELKNLSQYAKEQGVPIGGDWTELIKKWKF